MELSWLLESLERRQLVALKKVLDDKDFWTDLTVTRGHDCKAVLEVAARQRFDELQEQFINRYGYGYQG